MDKQVQFMGKTETGIFCQSLFGSAGAFEKRAGAPAFADWSTGDELRKFITKLSAADRKGSAYVLVNALGAGEYFGSNINADYFPWDALAHEGDDYGYKTFYNAHAFAHHVNKDPTRAFGKPVLSILNPQMKRVELIIKLDREKAKLEGADGVITRIDRGEFPDVSMGCRVPFDVCSICGNKSKTKDDYCSDMRPPPGERAHRGPNKILPDGRRTCVHNTFPRFFDLSFVFIGADKTAKVMSKLASRGDQVCFGDVCAIPRPSADIAHLIQVPRSYGVEKTASVEPCCAPCAEHEAVKNAAVNKVSEIVKNVPTGTFAMKQLPAMEHGEPDLPLDALRHKPLGSVLSTMGSMGMVMKPREFQTMILIKMGHADLARKLTANNQVFSQVHGFNDSVPLDFDAIDQEVKETLIPYLEKRSAFGIPFQMRKLAHQKPLPTPTPIRHSLLDKIAAAYNGYRRNLMMKLSQATDATKRDPQLRELIMGESLVSGFSKTASVSPIVPNSVEYFVGAHLQDRGLLSNNTVAKLVAVSNQELF